MTWNPTTLVGAYVRLEPLSIAPLGALSEVGVDASIWQLDPLAWSSN